MYSGKIAVPPGGGGIVIITYLLKDVQGEDILGGFYEEELQKVKHSDIYLVEKVLIQANGEFKTT
jgi:hypothetical protein